MKNFIFLQFVIVLISASLQAADCKIFFTSKSQVDSLSTSVPEIKELSKIINTVLKQSYQVLYKIDKATLGLASAIATGGTSIDDLKPEQWDKFEVVGNVFYQDADFSGTALRGAKLTFTEGDVSRTVITGSKGEFSESFSKLVPFTRIRVFSGPLFTKRDQSVPIVKLPLKMRLESKLCNAQLTLTEVPLEPLVFVVSKAP